MEIWRLPISAPQRGKLISVGHTSLFSFSSILSSDFARSELKVSESEAMDILKVASHSHSRRSEMSNANCSIVEGAQNAWDMLHEEESLMHIITSSADLENILGGGIHCKEVTEIDTEGSFMVERAFQIAGVCIEAMSEYNRFLRKDFQVCEIRMQPRISWKTYFISTLKQHRANCPDKLIGQVHFRT